MQQRNFGSFDIRINKLVLQETGTYNAMYNRPYEVDTTNGAVNRVVARAAEAVGGVQASALSSVASQLIKPTTRITPGTSDVHIPNGWNTRRLRFLMEVQVSSKTGSITIYYLQGYTDHHGASVSGFIDPNMPFFINSYMRVARMFQQTPAGPTVHDRVIETIQVLNHKLISGAGQNIWRMRPGDMFAGIQSNHLRMAGGGDVFDTRVSSLYAPQTFVSSRSNNVPTHFLAGFMRSYQMATELANYGQGNDNILNRAQNTAMGSEYALDDNAFLRALANIQGIPSTSEFTLNNLVNIDPEVSRKLVFNPLKSDAYAMLHQSGQTAAWHSSLRETEVAAQLANSVPTMMIENFIGNLSFKATNLMGGNQASIIPLQVWSIAGVDCIRECTMMLSRIQAEILNDVSYGNQDPYDIEMSVDIFGETRISVRMFDPTPVVYAVPSFGDGLFAPVYTRDENLFNANTHDLEIVTNCIREAILPTQTTQYTASAF